MTETLPQRSAQAGTDRPAQPRLPLMPGPWETAVLIWHWLRRMSTALVLLLTMAVASIVATFVPQRPVIPQTVSDWLTGEAGPGRQIAQVLDAAGLFDVFGSWWFATLTVLLFVSLTGCLIPRYRAFGRTLRRPPAAGRNLERLTNSVALQTSLTPEEALGVVDQALARRRYGRRRLDEAETVSGRAQLAAERGRWREGGSLLFHSAFYVLLIGAVIGQSFGFTGQINVVEGGAFSDTRIVYGLVRSGAFFGLEDHRGFTVRLDDFDARYYANGMPREFVSTVTILEQGEAVREREEIRVNHALAHDGMKLYQVRFGMAPRVIVRAGDTVLFDDRVMLADTDGVWTGAAKIKTSAPGQMALDLALLPDLGLDAQGRPVNRSPEARNPVLFADLWVGDLGLERAAAASDFIREGEPVAGVALAEGDTSDPLVGNLTVEFPELAMWSGFQVSHAPGRAVLLLAAVLILVGLIPSLYAYRRRVWADAWHDNQRTRLLVAGVALQRKAVFADAFGALERELRERLARAEDTLHITDLRANGPHDG